MREAERKGPSAEDSPVEGERIAEAENTSPERTAIPWEERALFTSEERLNLVLDAAQLGDWSWDAQSDMVTFSERAADLFGIPPGPHMTWTRMRGLLHPEDRERVRLEVLRVIAEHSDYDVEYRVVRSDGTLRWVSVRGRALYEPTGSAVTGTTATIPSPQLLGMIGVVQDITRRKRAEERVQEEVQTIEILNRVGSLLSAELDTQRLVQILTDEATTLSGAEFGSYFYNVIDAQGESYVLYTLSGVPREAFAGFPMPRNTDVFGPTFRGEGIVRSEDITRDARYGRSAPYHGMPKGHLPVRSYLALPVTSRTGTVLGGLFFGHSAVGVFTERHERLLQGIAAQAAIALDNARLYEAAQKEIREREKAQAEVLALNTRLQRSMAETHHRVKNNLQVITALINLQSLEYGEAVPTEELSRLNHHVQALAQVHDLLTQQAKQDAELEYVDVRAVMHRLLPMVQAMVQNREIRFTIQEALLPVRQGTSLAVLVNELVSNAIKHGRGNIDLTFKMEGSNQALLSVRDEGAGFPPNFDPERAAHTGLELITSLAHWDLQGTLRFENSPNGGAEVRVEFPLASGQTPEP